MVAQAEPHGRNALDKNVHRAIVEGDERGMDLRDDDVLHHPADRQQRDGIAAGPPVIMG